MKPETWAKVQELYQAALERAPSDRGAFLEEACAGDEALLREVRSLLSYDEKAERRFMEEPAVEATTQEAAPDPARSWVGRRIQSYEVLSLLGAGGMGEVYRARDPRLGREVAIKVLPAELSRDPERLRRFEREARITGALNHPNILDIHDIGTHEGSPFIVCELLEGETLRERLTVAAIPFRKAIEYAVQIARGLAAAHEKGVLHRDLKPENLFLTRDGRVKILDFGLAKRQKAGDQNGTTTRETSSQTLPGHLMGTPGYMSPEQVRGGPVDQRSDIFAFGAVLYEMLSSRRAFRAETAVQTMSAILSEEPPALTSVNPVLPPALERIVSRCLEKQPEERLQSARDAAFALEDFLTPSGPPPGADEAAPRTERRERDPKTAAAEDHIRTRDATPGRLLRRRRLVASLSIVVVGVLSAGAWLGIKTARQQRSREKLVEIARLVGNGENVAAFKLIREVRKVLPDDPQLNEHWRAATLAANVRTVPSEVSVFWKDYRDLDGDWQLAGRAPLEQVRLPRTVLRWRFEKERYETVHWASWPQGDLTPHLDAEKTTEPGMVRIPGGPAELPDGNFMKLEGYWIGRHEVTNAEFKSFVDDGGYKRQEYWENSFVREGRTLTWEQAMGELRDRTGRPGPATWEAGTYPDGEDDFPVHGVSWYEAAAYARFVGKSLPTYYHWRAAVSNALASRARQVELSNFRGDGAVAVGSGLGRFGTYDMAGNVMEWCTNATGDGRRYILGGSWQDPAYRFTTDLDVAAAPFERLPTYGFRLAKYEETLPDVLLAHVVRLRRDYSRETPVTDEVFEFFKSTHAYDRSELDPSVERLESDSEHWTIERVSFDAGKGDERVPAYLFLPTTGKPPFQVVIYFPGSHALYVSSLFGSSSERLVEFIPRSGRALLVPVYHGTFERRNDAGTLSPNAQRDLVIRWSRELRRSIDYLESRDDIDTNRLAYFGFSLGARFGPLFTAVDDRFRAAILLAGGLYQGGHKTRATVRPALPEIDPFHFASRSTLPTLMINSRNDFLRPLDTHQVPLFNLLGTPAHLKRHALFDSGHVPPRLDVIKESLDWLDEQLGPVEIQSAESRSTGATASD